MSNNIEWCEAEHVTTQITLISPVAFQKATRFHNDVPAGHFGIPIESGGHTTVITGTLGQLQQVAVEILDAVGTQIRINEEIDALPADTQMVRISGEYAPSSGPMLITSSKTPIYLIGLPVDVNHALRQRGVTTVSQLGALSAESLLRIDGIDEVAVDMVKGALKSL